MARVYDLDLQDQWLQRIQNCQRSKGSVRHFCKRHGIPTSTFYFWRRTLEARGLLAADGTVRSTRQAGRPTDPAFVPILFEPPMRNAALELVLTNGRVLRIPPTVDSQVLQALAELLAVLEQQP